MDEMDMDDMFESDMSGGNSTPRPPSPPYLHSGPPASAAAAVQSNVPYNTATPPTPSDIMEVQADTSAAEVVPNIGSFSVHSLQSSHLGRSLQAAHSLLSSSPIPPGMGNPNPLTISAPVPQPAVSYASAVTSSSGLSNALGAGANADAAGERRYVRERSPRIRC